MSTGRATLQFALFLGADQALKALVLQKNINYDVLGDPSVLIQATRTTNFAGILDIPDALAAVTSSLFLATLVLWYVRVSKHRRLRMSLLTVMAGGVSNMIDRLIHGGVIDILAVSALRFNLADIYIMAGAVTALVIVLFGHDPAVHTPADG